MVLKIDLSFYILHVFSVVKVNKIELLILTVDSYTTLWKFRNV
jgi:hypothetical protein